MNRKLADAAWTYTQLIYGWMACCNLEFELGHDPESARFFRCRQREIERDMHRMEAA